jgi:hypothetical protein
MIATIVTKLIDDYCLNGDKTYESVASNVSSRALHDSTSLLFLCHYHDFKTMSENPEKLLESARCVAQLMSSLECPKRFWPWLLIDCIPLLEHEDCLFSSNETIDLMRCCQEVGARYKSKLVDFDFPDLEVSLEQVRLALSRNLARAVFHEAVRPTI